MKSPKILSFDAMNTLIRLRELPPFVYSRIARQEFGITKLPSEAEMGNNFRKAFGQLEIEMPCYSHGKMGGYRNWWTELIRRTFGTDIQMPTQLADRLIDYYGSGKAWELTENELLNTLKNVRQMQSNILAVVIVSNFDSRLRQILEQLSFTSGIIDEYFLSGEIGLAKPDSRIFQMVLKHYKLEDSPSSLLHIGDSVNRDLKAPLELGCRAFLYRPKGLTKDAEKEIKMIKNDQFIDSISELIHSFDL